MGTERQECGDSGSCRGLQECRCPGYRENSGRLCQRCLWTTPAPRVSLQVFTWGKPMTPKTNVPVTSLKGLGAWSPAGGWAVGRLDLELASE